MPRPPRGRPAPSGARREEAGGGAEEGPAVELAVVGALAAEDAEEGVPEVGDAPGEGEGGGGGAAQAPVEEAGDGAGGAQLGHELAVDGALVGAEPALAAVAGAGDVAGG